MLTNGDILTLGLTMFAGGFIVGLSVAREAIAQWKKRVKITIR